MCAILLNIKEMKRVLNIILVLSIVIVLAGIAMLIYGVHMFTYRGDFTRLERNLGEICFVFWLPVTFVGVLLFVSIFIVKAIKRAKNQETRIS